MQWRYLFCHELMQNSACILCRTENGKYLFQPCLLLIHPRNVWKDGELLLPRLRVPLKVETLVSNFLHAKGIWTDDLWGHGINYVASKHALVHKPVPFCSLEECQHLLCDCLLLLNSLSFLSLLGSGSLKPTSLCRSNSWNNLIVSNYLNLLFFQCCLLLSPLPPTCFLSEPAFFYLSIYIWRT